MVRARRRTPRWLRWLGALWAAAGLLIVGALLQRHVPPASLFLDPATTSSARPSSGLVSELGIMAWVVAATAAACAGYVNLRSGIDRGWARLGLSAAPFTAWLCLDDQFLVHSSLVPRLTSVPANACLVAYLALAVAWLLYNRDAIVRADAPVMVAAAGAMGFSEVIDLALAERFSTNRTVVEEGPKFLAILAWALFFVLLCYRSIERLTSRRVPMLGEFSAEGRGSDVTPAWTASRRSGPRSLR